MDGMVWMTRKVPPVGSGAHYRFTTRLLRCNTLRPIPILVPSGRIPITAAHGEPSRPKASDALRGGSAIASSIWNLAWRFAVKLVAFAASLAMGMLLSPEGFGLAGFTMGAASHVMSSNLWCFSDILCRAEACRLDAASVAVTYPGLWCRAGGFGRSAWCHAIVGLSGAAWTVRAPRDPGLQPVRRRPMRRATH